MYEAVIGLEVHAQLLTRSKAFCACSVCPGPTPNENVCPVCLGLPGALPVYNAEALRLAVRAAVALGCEVRPVSRFARKNYFYPDLPKGYQISQGDEPLAERGICHLPDTGRTVRITRVHVEEDAGKSLHKDGHSGIDLSRSGVPLVEIVSEPDIRSPAEAAEYLRTVREVLMAAAVSDADMERGNLRCDANVSIRPVGASELGVRVEIKNINSFRFVERALAYEIARQQEACSLGLSIRRETRGFDENTGTTFVMREKEEGADYRYFPDPDLPPICVDKTLLQDARARVPELPQAKRERYETTFGLSKSVAASLTQHPAISAFFEACALASGAPTRAGNFISTEILRDVDVHGLVATFPLTELQVTELVSMQEAALLTGPQAKALVQALVAGQPAALRAGTTLGVKEVAASLGFEAVDAGQIERVVHEVLSAYPSQVHAYQGGKLALFGFLVGQVMKRAGKGAPPVTVNALLTKALTVPPAPGDVD